MLKQAREYLGLSQKEMADEMGKHEFYVMFIESGKWNISRSAYLSIECLLRRKGVWTKFNRNYCMGDKK